MRQDDLADEETIEIWQSRVARFDKIEQRANWISIAVIAGTGILFSFAFAQHGFDRFLIEAFVFEAWLFFLPALQLYLLYMVKILRCPRCGERPNRGGFFQSKRARHCVDTCAGCFAPLSKSSLMRKANQRRLVYKALQRQTQSG
jgi:hypothetical protein